MDRVSKGAVVAELAEEFRTFDTMFVADYRGLDVSTITDLRNRLRDVDGRFRIVKNTLAKRAAEDAGRADLAELFTGPSAVAYAREDAATVAKVLQQVARETKLIELRGGLMDGEFVDADQVKEIANLPSREVILAMLLSAINAPMTQAVGVLAAPMRDIVGILDAYIEKLGGAPAEAAGD